MRCIGQVRASTAKKNITTAAIVEGYGLIETFSLSSNIIIIVKSLLKVYRL